MRGLSAPLSPNEEVTLRRVARGPPALDNLPEKHLTRLEFLKLIEANHGGYKLTPLGRQRYEGLPRPRWLGARH